VAHQNEIEFMFRSARLHVLGAIDECPGRRQWHAEPTLFAQPPASGSLNIVVSW
jgi:hypothetical protein